MINESKIYQQISSSVADIEDELIDIRRTMHSNPELGREEYKTSLLIQQKLAEYGSFNITKVGNTGFCADLISGENKPWIALRGDMDALPIQDQKAVSYKSQNPGVCHACGHDFHSTVVLGTAVILSKIEQDLNYNIRFIFQHAEEPTPGGAIDFVEAGMLENIDAIFGLHADPMLDVEQVGILPGWISAQSIHLKIELKGEGGHSSRPYQSSDPIHAGISILNSLYAGLYRMYKPETPFVFTIGTVAGGDSYNSISDSFHAEGTLRVTDLNQRDILLDFIRKTIDEQLSRWILTGGSDTAIGAPPVYNDTRLTKKVVDELSTVLNTDQLCEHERSMGGEDFSQFLTKAPGVFMRIGVGTRQGVHTGLFDIDEQAIGFAVKVFSWLLLRIKV
jgi:amidohydrolase